MRSLSSLTVCAMILIPALGFAAEPAASPDFVMEFVVPATHRSAGDIEVRCVEGCSWTRKTIACPESPKECRAGVAGRGYYDPQVYEQEPEAYPLSGTVCIGLNLVTDPPPKIIQKCEETDDGRVKGTACHSEQLPPAPDSRAYVHEVMPQSPGEAAGLVPGDLLLSVNGAHVTGTLEVNRVTSGMKPGQSFTALVERDEAPITLQGELGLRMSNYTCAIATAERIAAARKPDEPPPRAPFKLVVRAPGSHVEFRCLEGCGSDVGSTGDAGGSSELLLTLDQDHEKLNIGSAFPGEFPD